jgi:hypothetical protein
MNDLLLLSPFTQRKSGTQGTSFLARSFQAELKNLNIVNNIDESILIKRIIWI